MSEKAPAEIKSPLTSSNRHNYDAIKSAIIKGDYKICPKEGRSKVWIIFGKIQKPSGEEFEKIVACRICNNVYRFPKKHTSNLVRHKCYIAFSENDTDDTVKIEVDAETKRNGTEILTEWAIKNCGPFEIVADSGFKKVCQFLISVGATFGINVNTETLWANSTIIPSNIKNIYNIYFQKLKIELNSIKYIGFGLTSDLLANNCPGKTFISLTIHYIKDGELMSKLLGMVAMEEENCTDENIKLKVTNVLKEYDLELNEKAAIVTNRDSNMEAVFRNNKQICCINSLLHNSLQKAMQEIADVAELSRLCIKLIKNLEISDLNSKLNVTLNSFSANTWNTMYYVFMSIKENKNEIIQFFQESDEFEIEIEKINFNHISALITLLEPFQETFKKLEGESYPTIHLVYPYIHYLIKSCRIDNKDLEIIKLLKEKLTNYLENIVSQNLNMQHKLALFLFPPTNKLAQLPDNERQTIKDECKQLMKTYVSDETDAADYQSETPTNIADHNTEVFSEFISQPESNNSLDMLSSELFKYEALNIRFLSDFNVLQWWELRKTEFPHLYKVSQQILATPASSAASQRIFSMARNLISEKRYGIASSNDSFINEIMFLHFNVNEDDLNKVLLKI